MSSSKGVRGWLCVSMRVCCCVYICARVLGYVFVPASLPALEHVVGMYASLLSLFQGKNQDEAETVSVTSDPAFG